MTSRIWKLAAALVAGAVLAGGAYVLFTAQMRVALAKYSNNNVTFGAIATEDARSACPGPAGHARLVCLADALKASVTPAIAAQLQRPYSVAEAQKWSNFPVGVYRNRVGPTLGELNDMQRGLAKAMLQEAAGIATGEGLDELEQVLNADDYLNAKTGVGPGFASGNYHIALLGTPAATGTWELYFGGHHFAFGNTYRDGKLIGATPSFRGVEPFTGFEQNGRSNQPMVEEQAAFAAMLGALSPEENAAARLDQTFTNIIVGPQQDGAFPPLRDGLKVGGLTPAKQALVLAAIATYVSDITSGDAGTILAKYQAELPETFIAYSGSTSVGAENDYVRIDGPSVWIELSMQPGRSLPGVHPHSVWRDRTSDYGGNQ